MPVATFGLCMPSPYVVNPSALNSCHGLLAPPEENNLVDAGNRRGQKLTVAVGQSGYSPCCVGGDQIPGIEFLRDLFQALLGHRVRRGLLGREHNLVEGTGAEQPNLAVGETGDLSPIGGELDVDDPTLTDDDLLVVRVSFENEEAARTGAAFYDHGDSDGTVRSGDRLPLRRH